MSEYTSEDEETIGKTQSKPHLTPKSSVILLCLVVSLTVVGFLVGFFFPALPSIPFEIAIFILCSFTVIWTYLARGLKPEFMVFPFILLGIFLGAILNNFLSVDFLANPSIFLLIIEFPTVLVALSLVFWMAKNQNSYEKLRYIFLGVSLVSLLFAFSVFVNLVEGYLPLIPEIKVTSGFVRIDFSLVINIFKSLFLTGLFSFLERLLRIVEK